MAFIQNFYKAFVLCDYVTISQLQRLYIWLLKRQNQKWRTRPSLSESKFSHGELLLSNDAHLHAPFDPILGNEITLAVKQNRNQLVLLWWSRYGEIEQIGEYGRFEKSFLGMHSYLSNSIFIVVYFLFYNWKGTQRENLTRVSTSEFCSCDSTFFRNRQNLLVLQTLRGTTNEAGQL